MAPKKHVLPEGDSADEPASKIAKTEAAPAKEETTSDEVEQDFVKDPRKRFTDIVTFDSQDTTLNTISTSGGRVLMALSDGGLQYLVAGARANAGVKSGRYMFEVRVLEVLYPADTGRRNSTQAPQSRQHCRLGFSKQGSSLFLGESADSVCFDQDGFFVTNKHKTAAAERFVRDNVLGVLLNLDPTSPNVNTISLFKDGKRVSKPQPLPEDLKGQALFPHVAFRNVTLQVHFGPEPMVPLPFSCRMLQDAAQADLSFVPTIKPENGQFNVVFPIALPDEGTFDWLDDFLEKNPGYVELSDRNIVEWAVSSGFARPKPTSLKHSNDKPDLIFGIQMLDELTPRKLLQTVAPLVPRNYVVMEVRSNLLKAERNQFLARFNFPHYRRLAFVVVGEPPEEFKERARRAVLTEKQEKLDADWKVQQAEREKNKLFQMRQKQLTDQRKAFEAQKKAAEEASKTELDASTKEGDEVKAEEKMEDIKTDDVKPEDEVDIKDEPEELEPPKAELDQDEQNIWFTPKPVTDLVMSVFNASFSEFTLPEEEEDFEEVRYQWHDEVASKEYVKSWLSSKKITTRVEDLNPSEWFVARQAEWQKLQQEWQLKQREFRQDPVRKQAALVRAQREKAYEEKQEKERVQQSSEEVKQEPEAADASTMDTELEGFVPLDIYSVPDVCDIGDGEPLFSNFVFEDWSLMNLRFELLLLVRAFARDVPAEDRPGVHESHLPYYYNRYFRKPLNTKLFGVNTVPEMIEMVKDSVSLKENSIVSSEISEDKLENLDILARITEEARKERQRRIDAGDESARLKFSVLAAQQAQQQQQQAPVQQQVWGAKGVGQQTTPKAYPNAWGAQMGKTQWGKGVGPYPTPGFKGALPMAGKGWGPQNFGMPKAQAWR